MTKASWVVKSSDLTLAESLRLGLACPEAIAKLFVTRNITDASLAMSYLEPALEDLHDPLLMLGMSVCVKRIERAVQQGEEILIYGDYDVDGTTAIVLLKTAIERIANPKKPARVTYHVPHRLREGYGMQESRFILAAQAGVRLVISVDTGIRAFKVAAEAKALGLDLIVTDHHLPEGDAVPEALAVLNPAQRRCSYPNKHLCGAGVAFKLAHALLASHAKTDGEKRALHTRLLPSFLKLLAIATVADSVELTGENRAIVWLGLRELRNPVQAGLQALMQVAKLPLHRAPTATEIAFRLAPRINAAGRMDVASDVVELFLTRDPVRATELAEKLDVLNTERRAAEIAALDAIELQLLTLKGQSGGYEAECIVLDDPEWHRGVLGILASRVVDRTGRPALIMTSDSGESHGSGRSITGFHLLDALTAVHGPIDGDADSGVFHRFGGHAHAVGFSLPTLQTSRLRERMQTYSRSALSADMLKPVVTCDLEVSHDEVNLELCRWLARCAPFGMGNPEPLFLGRGFVLNVPPRIVKDRHVHLSFATHNHDEPLCAMGWSRSGMVSWPERCTLLNLKEGSVVDAVFRLCEKTDPRYPGIELTLVDIASAASLRNTPVPVA